MKKSKKPESFIHSPFYPGGNKAMDQFIHSELKYPPEAESKNIEGMVVVTISIDMDGKVYESKILILFFKNNFSEMYERIS